MKPPEDSLPIPITKEIIEPVSFVLPDPLYDSDSPKEIRCMYLVDNIMNTLELDFTEKQRVTQWLASKYME